MKKIYTIENIKKNLVVLQRRYSNMYNRNFSINQIKYAFNKLPGDYQDLLLKINKDENDKANLTKVYDKMLRELMLAKNVSDDIKIVIKNIDKEEVVRKKDVTLEDVEADCGDKWVRPVKKEKVVLNESQKRSKIIISRVSETKEEKKEEKIKPVEKKIEEKPIVKEEKPVEKKETDKEVKINKLKQMNERLKLVVMEEYIHEREKVDIDEIIDTIDMNDEDKFILMVKFENNSVKTNEEVSKELGITTSYIDNIVNNFYELSIKQKKKNVYKLERE